MVTYWNEVSDVKKMDQEPKNLLCKLDAEEKLEPQLLGEKLSFTLLKWGQSKPKAVLLSNGNDPIHNVMLQTG